MAPDSDDSDEVRDLAKVTAAAEAVEQRLREANGALLEANQTLAQVPLLEHRVAELLEENVWLVGERDRLNDEVDRLRGESDRLRRRAATVEESTSWRVFAPLRRLRRALRHR